MVVDLQEAHNVGRILHLLVRVKFVYRGVFGILSSWNGPSPIGEDQIRSCGSHLYFESVGMVLHLLVRLHFGYAGALCVSWVLKDCEMYW